MAEDLTPVFQTSRDSRELVKGAVTLARSSNPAVHKYLFDWLCKPDFLSRLDSAEDYRQTGRRLRVVRVLEDLARNPAPSAKQTLVDLTQNATFISEPARVDFLIVYTAPVRPAPPQLVKFWDNHCQPDDGFANRTTHTLVVNGGEPALAVLEKKFADAQFDADEKLSWMRRSIVEHRNDVPVLLMCERLLAGALPVDLRPALVEVLFDYRPAEWYRPASVFHPPDRAGAGPEAKAALRRIGKLALESVSLTARQREAVKLTLEEIGSE